MRSKNLSVVNVLADIVNIIGFLTLTVGLGMFLFFNDGIFFNTSVMIVLFTLCLLILPIGYFVFTKIKIDNKIVKIISIIELILVLGIFIYIILNSLILDFIQPLALNTVQSVIMIVGSVFILVSALLNIISKKAMISIVLSTTLLFTFTTGVVWANTQGYRDFNKEIVSNENFLFQNGEKGYATFRIPSLIALDYNVLNEFYDLGLENDLLLASAEGRKDSSHDIGRIDLVYKISDDQGKTWSELKVLLSYNEIVGKYGNPTPVLDFETGYINFPYMSALESEGYDYKTYNARFKIDKEYNLILNEKPLDISFEKGDDDSSGADGVRKHTLMVGPGKSIQISNGEYSGRLVVPSSSGGDSFAMYSDDNGLTWQKGESAGKGNECEVAELKNGELVMVVRDNIGCSNLHFEQYQRLSYSKDGGKTWYEKTVNTPLKTPICMASIDTLENGDLIMTYPDSFYTRVNLTIAISSDNGKTWTEKSIYNGAAGYSCVTVDSEDNIYVLSEIGKINYNEVLYFAKLNV